MKDKRTLLYSTPPSLARLCKDSMFQFKMLRVRERPRISHWPPAQGFLQMQFWSAKAPPLPMVSHPSCVCGFSASQETQSCQEHHLSPGRKDSI